MKINKESVSLNSFETMANYYFKEVDTKSFNAYYERPNLLRMIGSVEDKSVLMQDVQLDFILIIF